MRSFTTDERGLALLDTVIACAILATIALTTAFAFGSRPERTHTAAVALEAAVAEARGLAAASGDASNVAYPTGATVIVERDPLAPNATRIAVYHSRPVIIAGRRPFPPPPDAGFPAMRVSGTFRFLGNRAPITEPFAIMLSGGGYASIVQLAGTYDETAPPTFRVDPGCPGAAAQIEAAAGNGREVHPFGCIGGMFVAN